MQTAVRHFKTFTTALLLVLSFSKSFAANQLPLAAAGDSLLSSEIRRQLQTGELKNKLYFPAQVARFYAENGYQPIWIKPQPAMGHAWQAMLLIDCVQQYGLWHNDYHPNELTYETLHLILDTPGKVGLQIGGQFELLLTDALLTLMNHLHYGKLNPVYSRSRIDSDDTLKFNAATILTEGLKLKDIMTVIEGVQPKIKAYTEFQGRMRLIEGVYQGDCYEVPKADVRRIAINMERLRWAEVDDSVYIDINIPSYMLAFFAKDTIRQFKVIVGKPATPTPTLNSEIRYLTTAPEWKVPAKIFRKELLVKALADTGYLERNHFAIYDSKGGYVQPSRANLLSAKKNPSGYLARQSAGCDNALGLVVFRFPNSYDVYLHDTPEQQLFKRDTRAFSHGCVRIEKAGEFAEMLLKNDGSVAKIPLLRQGMQNYITRNVNLKKPVPIRITYLTCGINEWGLVNYPDIYGLDKSLEMALYGTDLQ